MSAPLKLNADQLRHLSYALDRMSFLAKETGVRLDVHGRFEVGIEGNVLTIGWDEDAEQYVLDDRIGD